MKRMTRNEKGEEEEIRSDGEEIQAEGRSLSGFLLSSTTAIKVRELFFPFLIF